MRATIGLLIIGLLFATSCTSETTEPEAQVFVIEEAPQPKPIVFEIAEETDTTWKAQSKDERNRINRARALHELEENEEDFQRRSELKNVRRTIDGKTTVGYDPDLDDPDVSFEYDLTTNDDPDSFRDAEEQGEKYGDKTVFIE